MSFDRLIRRLEQLEAYVNQLDRRQNNFLREAVVTEVFPSEGLARVDAHGVVSKKSSWLTRSGDIGDWNPVTVGERVLYISPTGEPGKGLILPGGYSQQFPAPHDKGAEKVTKIGDVTIKQTGSAFIVTAGGVTVEISAAGLKVNGGRVEHDGKNIGKDHKHSGVVPGSANSDVPIG